MKSTLANYLYLSILAFFMSGIYACHNPYKGMCKEDRDKMKMVAQLNKMVSAGGACTANKDDGTQKKAEEKLAKKSRKMAAKK